MVAFFQPACPILRLIAELRQLVIEGLHRFGLLPEQIGNQDLLAVLDPPSGP
jgi:hypothetical protein